MLMRILWAVVVGIITGLVAWLVGMLLVATGIAVVVQVGNFLVTTCSIIGILAGLIYFVSGRTLV